MRRTLVAALAVLAAAPRLAAAIEVGDGKLSINGNGSWSYQRTLDNTFLEATPEGNWRTTMFDLVLSARPTPDLVITAQLGFDPDDVSLEWGFAEWRWSDQARLRLGKVKQPLGNYGELQFVGTTRPFYTLPVTVYGPANISSSAYEGVGLTGEVLGDWTFQYDAYGGATTLQELEPYAVLLGETPEAAAEIKEQKFENVLGGRVSVTAPFGTTFRFSGMGGMLHDEEGEKHPYFVYGASAFHRGERLWLSAEVFHAIERDRERQVSGYVEAAWFLSEHWQVAARGELARTHLDGVTEASPLLRHDEVALGLDYWFTPGFVVKASAHWIDGCRFAMSEAGEAPAGNTWAFIGGAQFTF